MANRGPGGLDKNCSVEGIVQYNKNCSVQPKKSLTEVAFNQGKVVVAGNFKNLTKFPHKNAQSNFS